MPSNAWFALLASSCHAHQAGAAWQVRALQPLQCAASQPSPCRHLYRDGPVLCNSDAAHHTDVFKPMTAFQAEIQVAASGDTTARCGALHQLLVLLYCLLFQHPVLLLHVQVACLINLHGDSIHIEYLLNAQYGPMQHAQCEPNNG